MPLLDATAFLWLRHISLSFQDSASRPQVHRHWLDRGWLAIAAVFLLAQIFLGGERAPIATISGAAVGLEEIGWLEGRNIHIEWRFSANNFDRLAQLAQDIVALNPDVIFVNTTPAIKALQHETHSGHFCPSI